MYVKYFLLQGNVLNKLKQLKHFHYEKNVTIGGWLIDCLIAAFT